MAAVALTLVMWWGATPAPDTLVVCPESFAPAMRRWVRYREGQGHRIEFLANTLSGAEIRRAIRHSAKGNRLRFVVLVGDAEPPEKADGSAGLVCTPTHHAPAKVIARWGPEPTIATDNAYADLDDDQVPDVAVGRLTADTAGELDRMLEKTLAYEQSPPPGEWRRRVSLVAGTGGFGLLVDSVIEAAARKFLTEDIPPGYVTSMTYGSWRSPFCPDPRRFREEALARLGEGCLFWVYMGHGEATALDDLRVPGAAYPVLAAGDLADLRRTGGAPIAVFLSCYAGALDAPRDCLAEELLRSPGGAVAVVGASRVAMPYAMAVLGTELMQEYFQGGGETLGEVVLRAKRRMAASREGSETGPLDNRRWLDSLAGALSPSPGSLPEERMEHVLMFNLLGDPLLRLRRPRAVRLHAGEEVEAGQRLQVTGETEIAGQLTLELACRRDRTTIRAPRRQSFPRSPAELAAYSQVYARANDGRWAATAMLCGPGVFRAELRVPEQAEGPCFLRAFVDGGEECALGAAAVLVRRAGGSPQIASREAAAGESARRADGGGASGRR